MDTTINTTINTTMNDTVDETINDKIVNYFIDKQIIIKEDDDNYTRIKKHLLKYKRVIGLVLLIILLVIGYYCNPYNIGIDDSENNSITKVKNIQNGGAGALASLAAKAGPGAASSVAKSSIGDKIKGAAKNYADKSQAGMELKGEKVKDALKSGKDSAIAGVKGAPTAMYDAGASVAHKFTENADVIYQVFYSVAIFIVICIVLLPSIAFIVIGIICYFLLKNKMKTIKGL